MSHTDVDINIGEAFSPAKGIAGVKTFINNFAYIFAVMIVMLIMILAIWAGWITTTVKSRFGGPDMWSAGNAMQYQCIDLAGQSHCGPGGEDDNDRFRGGRERAGQRSLGKAVNQKRVTQVKPVSRFLNIRSNGNEPSTNQQVLDYYNQQIATGDNYTYSGGDTGSDPSTQAAVANANAAVAAAANASAAASAANTAANAAIAAANSSPSVTTAPAVATTTTTPTTSYFSGGGKKVTDDHLLRAAYGA